MGLGICVCCSRGGIYYRKEISGYLWPKPIAIDQFIETQKKLAIESDNYIAQHSELEKVKKDEKFNQNAINETFQERFKAVEILEENKKMNDEIGKLLSTLEKANDEIRSLKNQKKILEEAAADKDEAINHYKRVFEKVLAEKDEKIKNLNADFKKLLEDSRAETDKKLEDFKKSEETRFEENYLKMMLKFEGNRK